jgi:hypothetical protein
MENQSNVTNSREEIPNKTTERHVDNMNENPEDFEFVTKEENDKVDTENDGGFDLDINEGMPQKRDTFDGGNNESIEDEFGREFNS